MSRDTGVNVAATRDWILHVQVASAMGAGMRLTPREVHELSMVQVLLEYALARVTDEERGWIDAGPGDDGWIKVERARKGAARPA